MYILRINLTRRWGGIVRVERKMAANSTDKRYVNFFFFVYDGNAGGGGGGGGARIAAGYRRGFPLRQPITLSPPRRIIIIITVNNDGTRT